MQRTSNASREIVRLRLLLESAEPQQLETCNKEMQLRIKELQESKGIMEDECLMARYKCSFLERILREKGRRP
jgi:hypothetical protein